MSMTMPSVDTLTLEAEGAPVRSFLKWVGGKSQLMPQLRPLFPKEFGRYYEPFMGSAAVFFALQPKGGAFLSDSNTELVNAFNVVKKQPALLIARLAVHKRDHGKEHYYQVRKQSLKGSIEKAARFIYLNKTCFNGLYRVNMKGEYNVPMGAYRNPNILDPETIFSASKALQTADIRVARFDDFGAQAPRVNDFVYFDPPYAPVSNTSNFTSYTKDSFGPAQQKQLRDLCADLHRQGCHVVQSNSNTPEIRELYSTLRGFRIVEVSARRAINSVASKRGAIKEVVITNV